MTNRDPNTGRFAKKTVKRNRADAVKTTTKVAKAKTVKAAKATKKSTKTAAPKKVATKKTAKKTIKKTK